MPYLDAIIPTLLREINEAGTTYLPQHSKCSSKVPTSLVGIEPINPLKGEGCQGDPD